MASQRIVADSELNPGAANAIHVCLKVQPGERTTLITDRASWDIARALGREVEQAGGTARYFLLEELVERPCKQMPEEILESLEETQVSLFVAQAQRGELGSRMEMMAVVNRRRIRHAHMVNIDRRIMCEGMRADFPRVDELSRRLLELARSAREIRCTTPAGTDLSATFSRELKWIKTSGLITPEKWGNLPGGEIFTSPARVDGVFVADGVVGDYLCRKYGSLSDTPLRIEISDSRISHLSCANQELLREFSEYTSSDANSNRVGEFAIGTNLAIREVIGNILQDEKIPGVHVAFGHPYGEHTGQNWTSSTHIDCVGRNFDIWIEDQQVMRSGDFTL